VFEITRKYFATREVVVVVMVEDFITVYQLHDKIVCTSPPITLSLIYCCHFWKIRTIELHHSVLIVNSDIMFQHISLWTTFLCVYFS